MEMDQLAKERELSDPDPDIWRWSPLEIPEFDRMLTFARSQALSSGFPLRRLYFAEAGSGIGTKLYLAEQRHEMDATGFEINEDYIAKAEMLGVRTIELDLREASPVWSRYDIVYIARPFKDDEIEGEWERSVQNGMKRGAVLIAAYVSVKPYSWPCFYRAPFRGIWQKPLK